MIEFIISRKVFPDKVCLNMMEHTITVLLQIISLQFRTQPENVA